MGMGTSNPPTGTTTPTPEAQKPDALTNNQKLAMQIMAQQFASMGDRGAGPSMGGMTARNVVPTQTMQGGTFFNPNHR